MEHLDLCRMREVGYTSTKLHFANSWVSKPLKYNPVSVYVRDAFRISTWSLSSGLRFQVCNSRHSLFFCWRLSNSVALLWAPPSVFVVRPHAPNRDACTVTVRYEYMYRATPSIYIYIHYIAKSIGSPPSKEQVCIKPSPNPSLTPLVWL